MKILILLLIIIIYVLFFRECDCAENMVNIQQETYDETRAHFDKLTDKEMYISTDDLLDIDIDEEVLTLHNLEDVNNFSYLEDNKNKQYKNKEGRININKLPKCKLPIKVDYKTNINNMVNDGRKVVQDMVKPAEHKSMIGNQRHNLKQVSWTKSKLNWHDEKMPLEIRLSHMNTETQQLTHIIFPIRLVDSEVKTVEGFADGFFGLDLGKLPSVPNVSNLSQISNITPLGNIGSNLSRIANVTPLGNLSSLATGATQTGKNIFSTVSNTFGSQAGVISSLPTPNIGLPNIANVQNLLKAPEINKILDSDKFKTLVPQNEVQNIIQNIRNANQLDQNTLKNIIKENINNKLKEEATKAANQLIDKYPTLKSVPNITNPEIVVKVQEVTQKLPDVNIDKLDVVSVIKKKDDVDLEKLNEKLNKINFNEVTKDFKNQKFNLNDINSLMNLDTLVVDKDAIPSYHCCSPAYGKVVDVNLCPTATKVLDQENFYFTTGKDNSVILISKPQPYNKKLGKKILRNLEEPDELI